MAYGQRDPQPAAGELFILNGELRGVSVPLSDAEIRIGSAADCDVVLLDDDNELAELVLSPAEQGGYEASDAVGYVKINGRLLKSGKRRSLRSETPHSVGGIDFMIARSLAEADHSARSYHRRSNGLAWFATLAAASIVIAVVGFSGGNSAVVAKPGSVAVAQATRSDAGSFTAVLAAKALEEKLSESGLVRLETSADRENRTVLVRGKLRESEKDAWREAVGWFDASYGDTVQIDASLTHTPDSVTLPFAVEAVWMGATPRLTLHDGSKRQAGDSLPGGWTLKAISSNSLTISKNDETLVVPL